MIFLTWLFLHFHSMGWKGKKKKITQSSNNIFVFYDNHVRVSNNIGKDKKKLLCMTHNKI